MPEAWNVGEALRNIREKKRMTISEVAEATRMKMSVVEAIERNDFARFSASVYAKGFIKLYAECLELDPTPFLQAYEMAWGSGTQTVPRLEGAVPAAAAPAGTGGFGAVRMLAQRMGILVRQQWHALRFRLWGFWRRRFSSRERRSLLRPGRMEMSGYEWLWRYAGIGLAALLVAVLLTSAVIRWAQRAPRTAERRPPSASLRLAEEPPAPYADAFRR